MKFDLLRRRGGVRYRVYVDGVLQSGFYLDDETAVEACMNALAEHPNATSITYRLEKEVVVNIAAIRAFSTSLSGVDNTNEGGPAPFPDVDITTTSLPAATVGVAYSQQLQATGGDGGYTWSRITGTWPLGITMSSSGLVSGTPTTQGSSNVTVRADDGLGNANSTDDQALSLTVNPTSSAFYTFDPDDYADTTALFADSLVTSTATAGGVTELATAPGTPPWGGTKCVKSTYLGGQGQETQAGTSFAIENAGTLQLTEIWARTWIMWDDDFTTNGPYSGNADQKAIFWFMQTPSGSDRVEHNVGVFGSSIGHYIAGNGLNTSETIDNWWDGDWHEVRMHLALGQSPGSTTSTWTLRYHDMDKTYTYGGTFDDGGFSGDYIAFLNIFANLNKGSSTDISCYHGPIEFYSSDPGWGI